MVTFKEDILIIAFFFRQSRTVRFHCNSPSFSAECIQHEDEVHGYIVSAHHDTFFLVQFFTDTFF